MECFSSRLSLPSYDQSKRMRYWSLMMVAGYLRYNVGKFVPKVEDFMVLARMEEIIISGISVDKSGTTYYFTFEMYFIFLG